jgi:hypothetical protein
MIRQGSKVFIKILLGILLALMIFPIFQSYAEIVNDRLIIITPQYDYIIEYNGINYIVVSPSINAYPSLMHSQIKKYINEYIENYTKIDSTHDFYKIKDINEARVNPMKKYIINATNELGLKIEDIYTIISEPPIIIIPTYYDSETVVRDLWSMIRDKAMEYNVIIVVAKRLSPPEYKDKIDYYVRNKVVKNALIFYKNGVKIGAIGFGYTHDAVWIGVNMTNPSKEYITKVVKLARQLVDDPKIPIVIQFKIIHGVSTLEETLPESNGSTMFIQRTILATALIAIAASTTMVIIRRLKR